MIWLVRRVVDSGARDVCLCTKGRSPIDSDIFGRDSRQGAVRNRHSFLGGRLAEDFRDGTSLQLPNLFDDISKPCDCSNCA
jgi:hypothetical protein